MRPFRPVAVAVIAVLAASICVVSPATVATAAVSTSSVDSKCWEPRAPEKGFAGQINSSRLNNGLSRVSLDPELSRAARLHTWWMAQKDELYHTPSHRLTRRVTNWVILGENVGVGGTVDSLHDAFMGSPAHRENIMRSSFRHVGVGTFTRNGRLWVTVIFEGTTDPGTTLPMPRC